jgi:ABC-2 type transport system ATP-binding protein
VRGLDGAGVETRGLALRRPSLDDVFMALTGHVAEDTGQQGKRRGRRRGGGKDTIQDAEKDAVRAAS